MQRKKFDSPKFNKRKSALFFVSITFLFLSIVCSSLTANENVKYISFLSNDPPARKKPAQVTTKREDELLSEGYMPIGKIEVIYDISICLDDKCTEYPHKEDSTSRLLKEAALKGGDLVLLSNKNRLLKKEDIQGECKKWEEKQEKVEVPVYEYKKRDSTTFRTLLHYEDSAEEKTVCVEYKSWTKHKSSFCSDGTVWRKGHYHGVKKKKNEKRIRNNSSVPLARAREKLASSKSYKFGYIDGSGKFIIEPKFNAAGEFSSGLAPVQIEKNGKWGYINVNGKIIIDDMFETAETFKDGLALVKLGSRFGYITTDGIFRITPRFENASSFSEGMAAVEIGYKYGFIDKTGEIVIEPSYKFAEQFSEGMARVRIDTEFGFIDKSGKLIIKTWFKNAKPFSEGLATVRKGHKYGFIDKSGRFIIEPKFDYAESFSEGLASVQENHKYGYIDKSGAFIISPEFISAEPFSNGLAKVANPIEKKAGYIDKSGKFVFYLSDCETSDLSNFASGLATVNLKNNKYKIIDRTGKKIGEVEANDVYEFTN